MFLKKEVLYRACMALKRDNAFCVSSRVHDVLNAANKDSIIEVVTNLISQGELVTLKQLMYYMEKIGLLLDLVPNYMALYMPGAYLVDKVLGWCNGHGLIVCVKPLRDCLLEALIADREEEELCY